MIGSLDPRPTGGVQREAEEGEAANAGQRLVRLRLRRHSSAERAPAGEERQVRSVLHGFRSRSADGGVGKPRRIGPARAFLHVEELVAQGCNPPLGQPLRVRLHRLVGHPRPGAVREEVEGLRAIRAQEEPGDAFGADRDEKLPRFHSRGRTAG